ncbi:MAG: hypothetical protein ACR2G3_08610 [Solirubrobacterales bacterium]
MANYLDQVWLAYAFTEPLSEHGIAGALARVEGHYQRLYPEPLELERGGDALVGTALWQRPNAGLRRALAVRSGPHTLVSTGALSGAEAVVPGAGAEPGAELARRLLADPDAAARLNPPFTLAVHSTEGEGRMVIANDVIGAARLYAMELPGGWAWSNRLGALPLFAGVPPRADERAWSVLAATGWFLGEATAIEGVRQLGPASVVEAERSGGATRVSSRRNLAAVRELVEPRRARLAESADAAAEAARGLVGDVAAAWGVPIDVDLSGGRDSRVSAAAAIAAGAEIELRTVDLEQGELDVVEGLIERAPRWIPSRVQGAEQEPEDALATRLANLHLAHDGMRNPQAVLRAPMPIPHPVSERPVISGHGGELGHGFYYADARQLRRLRRGGDEALAERLLRAARKKHGAARDDAYAAYSEEVRRTLAEGRQLGLDGPPLLDYYYLAQRLANRSGLTTRNDRWSACSIPAFVRACFDLTPRQRLGSKMHGLVIGRLVGEWRRTPYFEGVAGLDGGTKRARVWEKPGHREELEAIIDADESWHELFQPDLIRAMWAEVLEGGGHHHYEGAFTRIAWRAGFEAHLDVLGRAATAAGS